MKRSSKKPTDKIDHESSGPFRHFTSGQISIHLLEPEKATECRKHTASKINCEQRDRIGLNWTSVIKPNRNLVIKSV